MPFSVANYILFFLNFAADRESISDLSRKIAAPNHGQSVKENNESEYLSNCTFLRTKNYFETPPTNIRSSIPPRTVFSSSDLSYL